MPDPIQNQVDGQYLAPVPAGPALFGEGGQQFQAELPDYYLGIYCVTNAQYLQFVEAAGHRPPNEADFGEPVWKGSSFPDEVCRDGPPVAS